MHPPQHLFLGMIFSLGLFFIFPQIGLIGFLIILVSAVLIDVDHYLYYVYKKKDLSLKNAYKWFIDNEKRFFSLPRKQRNELYGGFYFLHGIEVLIILFFLSLFLKYFLFIFIGFSFHLFLDIVYEIKYHYRIDKFSLVYDFIKLKRLKFIEDLR